MSNEYDDVWRKPSDWDDEGDRYLPDEEDDDEEDDDGEKEYKRLARMRRQQERYAGIEIDPADERLQAFIGHHPCYGEHGGGYRRFHFGMWTASMRRVHHHGRQADE